VTHKIADNLSQAFLDPPPPVAPLSVLRENPSIRTRILKTLSTARNIFGLRKRYHLNRPLTHDPETFVAAEDLCDGPTGSVPPLGNGNYSPYPNQSSFRLGNWYWNNGVQKSQESFTSLLSIVGDPEFEPQDIRDTKWSEINSTLAANDFDEGERPEWLHEDAGWKRKPINIEIPFHRRMKSPGTQQHVVFDLHYRSVVSVIKEKLANPADDRNFHYEPYEHLWKPTDDSDEARVYGEMYTSPAFQDAHRDLQEGPGEPNCDLPRVVVALMFSSDATQLTSFGNAQLWPCYMFFGNESKYRRCQPSCKLCNHVAYFQKVGFLSAVYYIQFIYPLVDNLASGFLQGYSR
jgi:hypothetical protein